MKQINFTNIDYQLLGTFLLILEESSVTKAAERLGVTQSSVSHLLSRLRLFFGDQLLVRSGQPLLPTERALTLKEPAQAILDGLQGLTHQREFNPLNEDLFFIVAANDMPREPIFPALHLEFHEEGIRTALSRTSCEYLFVVLFMILHPTHVLEPQVNKGRFSFHGSTPATELLRANALVRSTQL